MNLIPKEETQIVQKEIKEFNVELLKYLGNMHIKLMKNLRDNMNEFKTNKEIYEYINEYMIENGLEKSFPIGISINHVIAHDSYHEKNLINLKKGDFVTIDVGFIDDDNIIDAARTFIYDDEMHASISDCEKYVNKIEEFIRSELEKTNSVKIQKISKMTDLLVTQGGYTGLDFLGGHDVELGKVHGSKLILNKPLTALPSQASQLVDKDASLSNNEMFCIEIYMCERFAQGQMIQSYKIPMTHYELFDEANTEKMSADEKRMYNSLLEDTKGLAYDYRIHDDYNKKDKKIIESMIKKEFIVQHYPLEYKTATGSMVRFTQHENTFIITDKGELINLTKILHEMK
jgi:methionine aminopeptidase